MQREHIYRKRKIKHGRTSEKSPEKHKPSGNNFVLCVDEKTQIALGFLNVIYKTSFKHSLTFILLLRISVDFFTFELWKMFNSK